MIAGCGREWTAADSISKDGTAYRKANVVGQHVYCDSCYPTVTAAPGVWLTTMLPDTAAYDGYHCGDAVPLPKAPTADSRQFPGYGGPSRMSAWLPGGAKYTGALLTELGYGPEFIGPVRGAKPKPAAAVKPAVKPASPERTPEPPAAPVTSNLDLEYLRQRIASLEADVAWLERQAGIKLVRRA